MQLFKFMKIFKLRLFDFLIITLFIPIYLYDPKISNVFSNKEKFVIANINGNMHNGFLKIPFFQELLSCKSP